MIHLQKSESTASDAKKSDTGETAETFKTIDASKPEVTYSQAAEEVTETWLKIDDDVESEFLSEAIFEEVRQARREFFKTATSNDYLNPLEEFANRVARIIIEHKFNDETYLDSFEITDDIWEENEELDIGHVASSVVAFVFPEATPHVWNALYRMLKSQLEKYPSYRFISRLIDKINKLEDASGKVNVEEKTS